MALSLWYLYIHFLIIIVLLKIAIWGDKSIVYAHVLSSPKHYRFFGSYIISFNIPLHIYINIIYIYELCSKPLLIDDSFGDYTSLYTWGII